MLAVGTEVANVQGGDTMKYVARTVLFITLVIMIFYPAFCDLLTATRICNIMQVVFIASVATGNRW